MDRLIRLVFALGGFLALSSLPLGSAGAENGDSEVKEKEAIESIKVTARRREEDLQETPVSVAAMTGASLEMRSLSNYQEIGEYVPNLTLVPSTGGTPGMSATIRGVVSPDAILSDDAAVGIYIDGIYFGKNSGQMLEILDIERVEVLRGPQGTLYGKNTLGGAINFVTRKPSGRWGGKAKLTNGNRSLFNGLLALDFPVLGEHGLSAPSGAGELSGKATFNFVSREPFFNNTLPGGPKGFRNLDRYAGMLSLHWAGLLVDGLSIDYVFDGHHFDEGGPGSQLTLVKATSDNGFGTFNNTLLGLGNCALRNWNSDFTCFGDTANYVFGTPQQIKTSRSSLLTNQGPAFAKFEATGHALTLAYEFDDLPGLGDLTLKSLTGYRRMDLSDGFDFDGTEVLWVQRRVSQDGFRSVQQELQAAGLTEVAGWKLDYVIGLFYGSQEGSDRQEFLLIPALVPYCNANPAFCGGASGAAMNLSTTNLGIIDDYSVAPFGQATYTIPLPIGELGLTAGIRYTYEKKRITREIRTIQVDPSVPAVVLTPLTDFEDTFDDVAPMGTIAWQATPDLMTYVTVAKGFKSGGYNGRATTPAGFQPYVSEKLISYELGFKTSWLDDRLQLNAAGYFGDNYDRQVQVFALAGTGGVSTATRNAAKVHIWGAEIETIAQPWEGVRLNLGYGLTLPEYREFLDVNPATLETQDVSSFRDFMRTPKHDLILGGAYTLPAFGWGTVSARLDWHWQSRVYFGRVNVVGNAQDAYGLLHGRIQVTDIAVAGNGNLVVGVWGRNLLDEDYRENGADWGGLGFAQNQYGLGRSYGLDLTLEF